ncbi:MAG: type II secretion system inner membrane protein GspF [Pseudomonadota bacterium]
MAVFEYKGINKKGKNISGLVDADTVASAKVKLRKDGVFPTFVKESSNSEGSSSQSGGSLLSSIFNRISIQETADITRQLSTLVAAHIPLVEALSALVEQTESVKLKGVLSAIKDSVNEGSSLGNALELYPKVFSNLFINMVKAGEASGALDKVLIKLADFLENQVKLKNKITSTMAYPIIMAGIAIIMVIGLFTFVIPKITALFEDLNTALPLPTRILLTISDILVNWWYVVILIIAAIVWLFKRYISRPEGRYKYHAFLLKLPIFGPIFRLVAISRFAGTLSTLLISGVPLLNALNIVKNIISNEIIKEVIKDATIDIKEGSNLATPLKKAGHFPPLLIHMIAVGERVGNLEEMLDRVSASYENQVDAKITTLTSLLEPIMIVGMGLTVGFVVVAVLLPILSMQQMVK